MDFWAKTTLDGKPGISVLDHMLNVGNVARCLADLSPSVLDRFMLRATEISALAALHDLGKISPGFQRKCAVWLEENSLVQISRNGCWDTSAESDHGKISHSAIQDFLTQQGVPRRVSKYLATVLGGHHGRIKFLPNDRGIRLAPTDNEAGGINWGQERLACARKIWEFFKVEGSFEALDDENSALWWLAGLTSVADWIGSDERFFPADAGSDVGAAHVVARNALETIGFILPAIKRDLSFDQLFGFPPNEMQIKTLGAVTGPGVYVVEAPMGMGKTEAALGAAYQLLACGKASGIYFALPTQATSNRIHLRMKDFLQQISPASTQSRLIHGNSWLLSESLEYRPSVTDQMGKSTDDARNGRDWFASAKRALLAPYGVGTVDQALLGVVAAKHFFVRHFALAGKVVILDEVHSYDLYTGTLIDNLITTLEGLGCTVIVLSATLTGKRREQIVASGTDEELEQPYPLISGRIEGESFDPVSISPPPSSTIAIDFKTGEAAIEEALALASLGGAVLWICNTVDAAQSCFRLFKERVKNEFPLGLLHSRFPYWQREKLENVWMERFGKAGETRCGSILVSTQVVEQSVDLDADLLITELAPTDMLLQRLGRLWRHERQNRPVANPRVCIIEETLGLEDFKQLTPAKIKKKLGPKAFVYDPYILLRSLEVWRDRTEIRMPTDIRTAIEATYLEREDEPESWQELFFENEANSMAYRQKAQMSSNIWQAALDDREGVQTRLNEMPTVAMILCRSMTDRESQFMDGTTAAFSGDDFVFGTAKAIHRNLVKVPEYCFFRVVPNAALEKYLFGSQCVGIVDAQGKVTVDGLKDKYRLHYSDELGLLIEKLSAKGEV
jgi:CRISPR-associated endonuclease/helicase Cas3